LAIIRTLGLSEARQKALRDADKDPLKEWEAERARLRLAEANGKTFRQAAEEYITVHEASWRNPKHRQQWRNTLATYVYPVIGNLLVADIGVADVRAVIDPIWVKKPEMASRVRGLIETIINAAPRGR
jgi:hypothetical protein